MAGTGLDNCLPGDTDGGGEATEPVLGSTMGIALPVTRRAVGWWILPCDRDEIELVNELGGKLWGGSRNAGAGCI